MIEMLEDRNNSRLETDQKKIRRMKKIEVFFEYTNDISLASYKSIIKSKVKPALFEYPP